MARKLENIIQQALKTFKRTDKIFLEPLQNDFALLKTMMDDVTVKDLKLPKFLLQKSEIQEYISAKLKTNLSPMEYLCIYQDSDVNIAVFVLKQGAKLPIHDHPCMYGILKVIHGIIKVTNYSVVEVDASVSLNSSFFYKHPLKVIKHPPTTLSEKDSSCTLTPTERSIHEVECISGPAAFLDVLAPPYEEDDSSTPRGCHYFEEVEDKSSDGYLRLVQIAEPSYWTLPKEEAAEKKAQKVDNN